MKTSADRSTRVRSDHSLPWIAGLVAVVTIAYAAWQTLRELLLARAGMQVIFGALGETIARFARGRPDAAAQASKFISKWGFTSLELLLFAGLLLLGLAAGRSIWRRDAGGELGRLPPWLRSALALLAATFPAYFLLGTYWGEVFTGGMMRLWLLLAASFIAAVCLPLERKHTIRITPVLYGLALVGSVFLIAAQLASVTSHPFSLTWSEGNRLYDYSLYFIGDQYRTNGEVELLRGAAGRNLLWGLPFLIPNSPIWVHRLWNALLSCLPHLALGLALVRRSQLSRAEKWLFAAWGFLFLAQGPIYTPLILSAILAALFIRPGKPALVMAAAAAAGFYASLSRWTWLPAVPAWALFFLLSDPQPAEPLLPTTSPARVGRLTLRRLVQAGIVAGVALAGGLLANPRLLMPQRLAQGTALSQPLLWYRLYPNATYPQGVLWALFVACAPLLGLLVWLVVSRRWKINRVEGIIYTAACLIFLGGGLVASMKIGGGNNLHNLDLFLVSLVMLAGIAARNLSTFGPTEADAVPNDRLERRQDPSEIVTTLPNDPTTVRLPLSAQGLLLAVLLLPAWSALRSGAPLKLPPPESTRKALDSIRAQVTTAAQDGEVLFLDQRQLLTFGSISGVAMTPEYEKKDVMDQAMAGNSAYFEAFYTQLKNRRWTLIVSDIQFQRLKDSTYAFGEENNAWVKWVSEPLLCYYTPVRTLQNVDIQLLAPNPAAQNCP